MIEIFIVRLKCSDAMMFYLSLKLKLSNSNSEFFSLAQTGADWRQPSLLREFKVDLKFCWLQYNIFEVILRRTNIKQTWWWVSFLYKYQLISNSGLQFGHCTWLQAEDCSKDNKIKSIGFDAETLQSKQ